MRCLLEARPLGALAVAVALASAPAVADNAFYGKVNVSLQQYEEIDRAANAVTVMRPSADSNGPDVSVMVDAARTVTDNWQMNTNASRLGFKGTKELGNGLEAIFKIEYEVAIDDGTIDSDEQDELKARNVYGGLKGGWGQLIFGRNDTPFKRLGRPIDVFNDYNNGDITAYLNGEDRRDNMVFYQSPEWNGLRFGVAISPGEETGVGGDDNSGLADYTGLSVEYGFGERFAVGVALNDGMNDRAAQSSGLLNGSRFTVRLLDWNGFSAGLLVQSLEDDAGSAFFEETATVLSAAYQTGDWKFQLQLGSSEQEIASPSAGQHEWSQAAFGVERRLDDKVQWFAYYSAVEDDDTVTVRDENDRIGFADFSQTLTAEDATFGVGMEYKF